jgi:hypothetical protein
MPWTLRVLWIGTLIIAGILAVLVMNRSTRLRRIYEARLAEPWRERLFLVSVGFFRAVLVVRGITVAIHYCFGQFPDVSTGWRLCERFD